MIVAAGGGAILVKRVRAVGGGKIAASDFASRSGLVAGDCFDSFVAPVVPKG